MKLTSETKILIAFLVVILLGGGGLALLNKLQTEAGTTPPPPLPTPPPPLTASQIDGLFAKSRHQKGEASAKLTMVEFGDFQCPSCRRAYNKTLSQIEKDKAFSFRLGFFNLPLQMHERAVPAAQAAEAAGKQGKYWEMFGALFSDASEGLEETQINDAAKTAGLDMKKFDTDRKTTTALDPLIEADKKVAEVQKIDTTPTFILHDQAGNTAILSGAGNLERIRPDLKDGVLGNDPIGPLPDPSKNSPILFSIGGKVEQK